MTFEPWMFPIAALALILVTSRIVLWRLDQSEKRWLREHGDKAHQTPAE